MQRQRPTCPPDLRRKWSVTTPLPPASRDSDSGRITGRTADYHRGSAATTSFDWNGAKEPFVLATENDALNGVAMLFMKLLTNRAQIFADVRTYWSPDAVEARHRAMTLEGQGAKETDGIIHLLNSGAACTGLHCGECTR